MHHKLNLYFILQVILCDISASAYKFLLTYSCLLCQSTTLGFVEKCSKKKIIIDVSNCQADSWKWTVLKEIVRRFIFFSHFTFRRTLVFIYLTYLKTLIFWNGEKSGGKQGWKRKRKKIRNIKKEEYLHCDSNRKKTTKNN